MTKEPVYVIDLDPRKIKLSELDKVLELAHIGLTDAAPLEEVIKRKEFLRGVMVAFDFMCSAKGFPEFSEDNRMNGFIMNCLNNAVSLYGKGDIELLQQLNEPGLNKIH